MGAIMVTLFDGDPSVDAPPGLCGPNGRWPLPTFPEPPRSARDFRRFPYACTWAAYEHLMAYARLMAKHDGLTTGNAATVERWADWVFQVCQPRPPLGSDAALGTIAAIAYDHGSWPNYGDTFHREFVLATAERRGRMMNRQAV